ncbi:hypothetical protein BCR39DRAFT_587053 [Naematelia encephala]|uniref:C2H2-type domain-containing protein n=1 Tax=Naematelia encephala TaxID=71784 RepID=A0A1Y2BE17_9TREE|nr:hypothetical protein BCR39DRAFT_587053 [Naematelia encephala]
MTRVQPSSGRNTYPSRTYSTPSPSPDVYYPHSSQYRRYEPYARTQPPPRLFPTPPGHNGHQSSYAAKAYETNRPTGRYQPSRGAQRDAKWHARYGDRQHPILRSSPGVVAHARYPEIPIQTNTGMSNMERIRAEQRAAIDAARKAHLENVRKETEERKIRRIQLQVFVHARPTHCRWSACHAVMNSWALLERHLHHAHLHPQKTTSYGRVQCGWQGCQDTFFTREDCYRHCLIVHMAEFSGRCPFNCLFESPRFSDLLAHIGRRHPQATPDDFVPGLIHHRPPLPQSTELPKLPGTVILSEKDGVDHSVKAFKGGISARVRRMVARSCISGRRPRKEHFADRQGAKAAISAVIENSRRLSLAPPVHSAIEEGEDEADFAEPPSPFSVPHTARTDVDLIDVSTTAKEAADIAARQLQNDDSTLPTQVVDIDSESNTGSRPPSQTRILKIDTEMSETDSVTEITPVKTPVKTRGDRQRSRRGSEVGLLAEEGLKRSTRLRLRAERGFSTPT